MDIEADFKPLFYISKRDMLHPFATSVNIHVDTERSESF